MNKDVLKTFAIESDMLSFASALAKGTKENAIIYLFGPLGAGKTTFTRGFLRGLGFTGKVKSPTYAVVEPYDIQGRKIFHFDFYRIKDAKELEFIGIEDYFSEPAICLIEWPEKGFPMLPDPDLACYIAFAEGGREVCLKAHSALGLTILDQL